MALEGIGLMSPLRPSSVLCLPALLIALAFLLQGCAMSHGTQPQRSTTPALLNPSLATETAPEEFSVKLFTTDGVILIDVTRAWAPLAVDRFYNLVTIGFFDDTAFFRVIGGFVAQVGEHGDPSVNAAWSEAKLDDEPRLQSNTAGMVSFAMAGPGTRTTQIFINNKDNLALDEQGFVPFGKVRDIEIADNLYFGYGEAAPTGRGPDPLRIRAEGNAYLDSGFPELDWVRRARIASGPRGGFAGPQLPQPRPLKARRPIMQKRPAPSPPDHGGGGGGGGHGGHSH